jgi:NDP-sugar pyrophosphorylase family protein
MKALLLAAGLGTRLRPFTLYHPKALAMVNGKSLLQRNIEYLRSHGITEVIVNVHNFADQIIGAIEINKGWGSNISISDETDAVLETGGGLKKAAWYFEKEESFVVINVDMLTDMPLSEMIQQHQTNQPLATLAITDRISSRYFLFNTNNQLCGWRNTSTQEEKGAVLAYTEEQKQLLQQKAFSGIHIINPRIFKLIKQEGNFSLVDVYMSLCADNIIEGFNHSNSLLIDVGKPESIVKAEELFE